MYIRIQQASTASDREEVYRFRYRIEVEELGQASPTADPALGVCRDPSDERARILVAVDESTGAILGTLRAIFGCDGPFPPDLVEELDIHSMIVAFGDERISCSGAFLVDPAYRGQTVTSQLANQMVRWMLAEGVEVDTCRVPLSQARTWFQLGYRPYGAVLPIPGSTELAVPLALVLRDRRYLEQVGSPLVGWLEAGEPDQAPLARRLRELYPHFEDQHVTPKQLGEFWASVAHSTTPARPATLFGGLDRQALDPLLRQLPTMRVGAGRALPIGGAHEQGLGLILRGRLGLTMEEGERPFFVSVLQAGDVFGSLADIVTTPPSARLVAIDEAEVLVLDEAFVAQLEPRVAERLRHNLGAILSQRLEATNRQVAGFMRGSPERIPLAPEFEADEGDPWSAPADPTRQPAPPSEVHPLDVLERDLLARLPTEGGAAVLELSAGTGDTTLLLARAYPQARIVALEPDPALLARAEARALEQGLEDHCTFVAGQPERIPLEPDTVDLAYLRLTLRHVRDPRQVLSETVRTVRPGGLVAAWELEDTGLLAHPEPRGLGDLARSLDRALAKLGCAKGRGRQLAALLREAGLEDVHSEVLPLAPPLLPVDCLAELLHDCWLDTLESAGGPSQQDWVGLNAVLGHHATAGAWLYAPAVLAWGRVPQNVVWL